MSKIALASPHTLLSNVFTYVNEYPIRYKGKWLSLNTIYSTHRWLRNQEKKAWMHRFRQMLTDAQIPRLEAFKLHIRYNSRMDCDNLTGGSKILVDTMRELNIIQEDNKYIYQAITIEADTKLKHNQYLLTIISQKKTKRINE